MKQKSEKPLSAFDGNGTDWYSILHLSERARSGVFKDFFLKDSLKVGELYCGNQTLRHWGMENFEHFRRGVKTSNILEVREETLQTALPQKSWESCGVAILMALSQSNCYSRVFQIWYFSIFRRHQSFFLTPLTPQPPLPFPPPPPSTNDSLWNHLRPTWITRFSTRHSQPAKWWRHYWTTPHWSFLASFSECSTVDVENSFIVSSMQLTNWASRIDELLDNPLEYFFEFFL